MASGWNQLNHFSVDGSRLRDNVRLSTQCENVLQRSLRLKMTYARDHKVGVDTFHEIVVQWHVSLQLLVELQEYGAVAYRLFTTFEDSKK